MTKILIAKKTKNQRRVEKATEKLAVNTIEMISDLMGDLNKQLKKSQVPEDILERKVKSFGNASHIILPKEYEEKKAIIIIKK